MSNLPQMRRLTNQQTMIMPGSKPWHGGKLTKAAQRRGKEVQRSEYMKDKVTLPVAPWDLPKD